MNQSTEILHHVFQQAVLQAKSENIPTPAPLCTKHYNTVYDTLHPRPKYCATCGTTLKYTQHRKCPDPDAIQRHLREHTNFEGKIEESDKVCLTCYKSQLVILQSHTLVSTEQAEVSEQHYCDDINGSTRIPTRKWHNGLLNCRDCKRKLVNFLGDYFLSNIHLYLTPNQKFYVAGAFKDTRIDTAWYVSAQKKAQPDPTFFCKAEEADTRIWLHTKQTYCEKVLILSADTDTYHIGCALKTATSKDIIIQLNKISSRELKYLHLTNLLKALANDPDLAHINPTELPQILQTLYVCTGCDYTSFFSRVGKATFLRYFFQHASFITSTCTTEATRGTLANVGLENSDFEKGFLAFTRLVGTAYFKLHSSSFQCTSPATHFMSLFNKELTVQEHHSKWLESIRQAIWYRVKFENEEIPSDDALMLHWKRSCWIMHMW